MNNSLSSIITRLLKFGDTALFSDSEIAKAANQLSEIEFELEFLRNENKVLNEIKREYLLKKTFELDFEKICRFQKHLYIDGVCAECGHVEAQQTQIVNNLKVRDYMWTCENGHFNPPQWYQPFCLYCKTPRGES
mgnify:CR=1 FL=1